MANKTLNGVKLNVTPAEIVSTPTQIGAGGDPTKSENIAVSFAKMAGWYAKMTATDGGNNIAFTGDAKSVNGINVTNAGALTADSTTAATELTFTNTTGGENTIKLKDTTYTASNGIKLDNDVFSHSNSVTEKATVSFVKVAYDAQGHITSSSAVTATDIPVLPASKITSGTFADARIASAATWNAKQDALTFETAPSTTNKVATMADITNATSGLTGAMHFIGTKTEIPSTGTFEDGDVICVGNKEYVYDSSKGATISDHWILLGDEGSYALNTVTIKGANGLTGQGKLTGDVTISHANKAVGLTNLTADGRKYVTGLTFDAYGHVSGYTTGTETTTNTTYSIAGKSTSDGWVTTLTGSDDATSTSTVPLMKAATASAAGTAGLVPAPAAGKQTSFLRGDGTWAAPTNTDTKQTIAAIGASKTMYITGTAAATGAQTGLSSTKLTVTTDASGNTTLTATKFVGDGSGLTNISASTISASGVTAGSYGLSTASTPGFGDTVSSVPYFTVGTDGRITSASETTIKIPNATFTSTKVGLVPAPTATKATAVYFLDGSGAWNSNPIIPSDTLTINCVA